MKSKEKITDYPCASRDTWLTSGNSGKTSRGWRLVHSGSGPGWATRDAAPRLAQKSWAAE